MTAFVTPGEEPGRYGLRWFTPVTEVRVCAHATLAGAHVLWSAGAVAPGAPIAFSTSAGVLTAVRDGRLVPLDLPARPVADAVPHAGLGDALGLDPVWTGWTDGDWIVEVERPEDVAGARPDPRLGRPVLTCHQASSRGGILRVEPRGDRVRIAGHAVTVLEGRLLVPEAN
jgi:predicted PhzF superfamily epimerase YddE/YHI9